MAKPCGTNAKYVWHIRHGETPCQPCRDAHTERYRRAPFQERYRAPEIRPGKFCQRCDSPLPKGRSKFCSEACDLAKTSCRIWPKTCPECRKPFIARNPRHVTCSPECKRKRANRTDDYHRWKHSVRRTVNRETDITKQQEAAMRKRARKCLLCKTFMTSKSMLPNSKELDHIVPINIGGTHTHGNVRIICRLCNLKRPKDGSDYYGQITLWATDMDIALIIKPRPQPRHQPPRIAVQCPCGSEVYVHRGRTATRCPECQAKLGREAAALRAAGMKWQAICDTLGYANTGSLYNLAWSYGRDVMLMLAAS